MSENRYPPYESFRHGLVVSKLWLCEELERVLDQKNIHQPDVHVLGSWSNILSFMMVVRRPHSYKNFIGYDIDPTAKDIADKLCDAWLFEKPNIKNVISNVNEIYYPTENTNVIVNCSVDHLPDTVWFDKLPSNSIVCIQAVDIDIPDEPWAIRQVTPTLDTLIDRYPMTALQFSGTKRIQYETWGYNRFMIIGVK
jgi:hypothetical protein